jgi:hypothetical protein
MKAANLIRAQPGMVDHVTTLYDLYIPRAG